MSKPIVGKAELVATIQAKHPEMTKAAVAKVVDALLDSIKETMAQGGEVSITGFGKFHTVNRAARTGRNPQTGVTMQIPASVGPKFTAGKALKDAVASK